ncbi:MAG: BatD family protein [Elusimicrobiota bacterium]|nr:BatD family protein [Elusimicrobiota bacterium]
MKKFLSAVTAAALAALLLAAPASAVLNVAAGTDRDSVEINGNLYLTVTVSGDSASVPEPKLPNMQSFNIYSSGRSQSISIINGKITTTVSFTYILTPRFIGVQTIPSISVFNGKEKAATPEMQVTVTKARQPAAQQPQQRPQQAPRQQRPTQAARTAANRGEQIFIKAETDKKTAYPGEQINISIKFYTSVPLSSNPQYVPAPFRNLISEDLPPVRSGETDIGGVRYAYSEIKAALFALNPGPAEIQSATVIAQVPSEEAIDPFDPNFFQKFMAISGAQGQSREFATDPIKLDIKPLPPGAPAGFSGAVGNYSVTAAADRPEARAGEAVNFSITIIGSGNLKAVTAPKFPELPDFKVFDTMSSLDVRKEGDVISGKKTFTYILVPRSEGKRTIPPIKFSYFEPHLAAYRELQTDPVTLLVEKGGLAAKSVNFNPATAAAPVTASGSDIRYVSDKPGSDSLPFLASSVLALPYWTHSVPVALLLLSFWLARFNRFKLANPLLFRFRRARSEASRDIEAADILIKAGKPNEAVARLYDSFMKYLSDKCGVKVSALTIRKAAELVKARFPSATERSLDEVRELWGALELRHFSPEAAGSEGASDLAKKYSLLLVRLEKELK